MPNDLSMLSARRLVVPMQSRAVSQPLSFDVGPGEVLALVGPENSGKSALCRAIAGLSRSREGILRLGAADMAGLPPERRRVGYAGYRTGLIPHLSLAANLLLPLQRFGYPGNVQQSRVRGALRRLRLEKTRGALPDSLSEGQKRLFAIERAAIYEPDLLVFDNPARGLGGGDRRAVIEQLTTVLRRFGGPAILAMRDFREAMQLADKVAVMQRGTIEQIGSPQAVYEAPYSIGAVHATGGANLLAGRVTACFDDTCLVALDGGFELRCVADPSLEPGDPAIVAFRPDLAGLGVAARHMENRFRAQIHTVLHRGATIEIRARGLNTDNLKLRLLNLRPRTGIQVGTDISVGLSINVCRALPLAA